MQTNNSSASESISLNLNQWYLKPVDPYTMQKVSIRNANFSFTNRKRKLVLIRFHKVKRLNFATYNIYNKFSLNIALSYTYVFYIYNVFLSVTLPYLSKSELDIFRSLYYAIDWIKVKHRCLPKVKMQVTMAVCRPF